MSFVYLYAFESRYEDLTNPTCVILFGKSIIEYVLIIPKN